MIDVWRAQYAASPLRAVLVTGALPIDELRAQIQSLPFQDYYLADRGRYRLNDSFQSDALDPFKALAQQITGKSLAHARVRVTRHVHGDYAQPKDDAQTTAALELTIDLSSQSSDEGQIVYFNATGSLVMPQTPGACALVDRTAPLTRYERYLTHRLGDRVVHRLRLLFT